MNVNNRQHARVLVVCASPIVAIGIRHIVTISSEHEVCGEARSIIKAKEYSVSLKPDVIFLDLSIDPGESLLLLRDLHVLYKKARILVYSPKEDDFSIRRAISLGANAAICGNDDEPEILRALDAAAHGRRFVSMSVTAGLSTSFWHSEALTASSLTDREHQVFRLLGEGHKIREIAGRLCLGEKTVESHLSRIKTKLKLKDMVSLRRSATLFSASQVLDQPS